MAVRRSRSRPRCLLAAAVLATSVGCTTDAASAPLPALKDGDIVFHESRSSQSRALRLVTGSRYTHMGIVYHQNGRPMVFEAIGRVSLTPLAKWIRRGVDQHVVVKRLKDRDRVLKPQVLRKMKAVGDSLKTRTYDLQFLWSDRKMYCSELVWKIYKRGAGLEIGKLQQYRDFRLDLRQARAILAQRFDGPLPLDEPVITPVAMFESPRLQVVFESASARR